MAAVSALYVVQAFLAVGDETPAWRDVTKTLVEGWRELDDLCGRVLQDPVQGFFSHTLAFGTQFSAEQAWAAIDRAPQRYPLRIVHRVMERTETPLPNAGHPEPVQRRRRAA